MNRIKECRQSAGLTIRGLAEKVGVSPSTITEVEAGRKIPRADTLRKIADVCGVTMDTLWPPAKKMFTVNGHEIEITRCTAIAVEIDSTTRASALLVHDLADEFRDGDSIYFENMPADDEEAASMLADFEGFHDYTTLETVVLDESKG